MASDRLRNARRQLVDFAFVDRPVPALAACTALVLTLWLALALAVVGVVGSRTDGRGAIAVADGDTQQTAQWASALRLQRTEDGAVLSGMGRADAREQAWLNANICKGALASADERAARAWRIRNNERLCAPVQRRLAVMPLAIQFGPIVGLIVSVLLLLGSFWMGFQAVNALIRIGRAYRRLYASEHRVDRKTARA